MEEEKKEMSFFDHLEELRWRLLRSVIAIVFFGVFTFIFKDFIFNEIIFGPTKSDFISYKYWCLLIQKLNLSESLCLGNFTFSIQNTEIAGQFMVHLKIAMALGLIMAFPYLFWELWRFITPGLHDQELKASRKAILASAVLFFIGILFGYLIITPFSLDFLSNYTVSEVVNNQYTITNYIDFLTTLVLINGIMFQLPMAVFLLAKIGIVTAELMIEYWRYAFVACMLLSAIITPPDIASMVMVGVPFFGLYLLSILVAKSVNKK